MIYFRELVTFLSLLAWIEMATTVMNGNDSFRNGNDCSKWQRPFTKGKIAAPIAKTVKLAPVFQATTEELQNGGWFGAILC